MVGGPLTFHLPEEFEVPPSSDGEDFETLATLRRLPDGSVRLVAVDGNSLSDMSAPENDSGAETPMPENQVAMQAESPQKGGMLDTIEARLDGVSPSDITF